MQYITTDGLIISSKECGENDRLVTMLTPELGRIRVIVKGGRSIKSAQSVSTQQFSFGNYELNRRGDMYIYHSGSADRVFFPFQTPVERSALMYYLAEIAAETTDENEPADEQMRMLLNAFYLLFSETTWNEYCRSHGLDAKDSKSIEVIKAAFELRTAVMQGYAPELQSTCSVCGKHDDVSGISYLDVDNGRMVCPDCVSKLGREVKIPNPDDRRVQNIFCPLSAAARSAAQYICEAPQKRLYSFSLADRRDVSDLAAAAETYLLYHLEYSFPSLDFYKTIQSTQKKPLPHTAPNAVTEQGKVTNETE